MKNVKFIRKAEEVPILSSMLKDRKYLGIYNLDLAIHSLSNGTAEFKLTFNYVSKKNITSVLGRYVEYMYRRCESVENGVNLFKYESNAEIKYWELYDYLLVELLGFYEYTFIRDSFSTIRVTGNEEEIMFEVTTQSDILKNLNMPDCSIPECDLKHIKEVVLESDLEVYRKRIERHIISLKRLNSDLKKFKALRNELGA